MLVSKTEYRPGTPNDYEAIKEFIQTTGYFLPVDPVSLGGHWIVAQRPGGRIVGTVWYFGERPHAFVDYWSGRGRIGPRLLQYLEAHLREYGYEYARGAVWEPNLPAKRLLDVLGVISAPKFLTVYKDLQNGRCKHNDDTRNDDTGQERAGEPNPCAAEEVAAGR